MDKLMDQVEAELVCAQCGRTEKHPVSWFLANSSATCPMCGEETDLTSPEWKRKIQVYVDACKEFDI